MSQLRERGVYKTPDGKELVACAGILGYYLLYSITKGTSGIPAYVVDAAGHITSETQPTNWKAEDLRDTGRTFLEMFLTPVAEIKSAGLDRAREDLTIISGGIHSGF